MPKKTDQTKIHISAKCSDLYSHVIYDRIGQTFKAKCHANFLYENQLSVDKVYEN